MDPVTYAEMVDIAANLASENAENPEYDRGMAELIADSRIGGVLGVSLDERAQQVLADISAAQHKQRTEWEA